MSLFFISADTWQKEALERQLDCQCHTINSIEQLCLAKQRINADACPVLLIDDTLNSHGHISVLETIVKLQIRGMKILLVGKLQAPFVLDNHIGLLKKPIALKQLMAVLEQSNTSAALHSKGHSLSWGSDILIGESEEIRLIRKVIFHVKKKFTGIHINGETGTGKEVVATLLSAQHNRITVNCSTIPPTLADSVMFGSKKGAYTDAKESREGLVKAADGGILFLDELEDLHKDIQGKFLRLLETNRYRPAGGTTLESSNFRLITASNIPLKELSKQGLLRFDLYNRLNRLVITIPPLRQRREDIPALIDYYLHSIGESRPIDAPTMERMMSYSWPGNVRELFKELDLLVVFAPEKAKTLSYREILTESMFKESYVLPPFSCPSVACEVSQL